MERKCRKGWNGESRQEIKKEGTKFLEENWNSGEKYKKKIVEKGKESLKLDKTRKVKIRKSLFCVEKE